MKPRLYRRHRVWVCSSGAYVTWTGRLLRFIGHGYTPREAYDDWKAQL